MVLTLTWIDVQSCRVASGGACRLSNLDASSGEWECARGNALGMPKGRCLRKVYRGSIWGRRKDGPDVRPKEGSPEIHDCPQRLYLDFLRSSPVCALPWVCLRGTPLYRMSILGVAGPNFDPLECGPKKGALASNLGDFVSGAYFGRGANHRGPVAFRRVSSGPRNFSPWPNSAPEDRAVRVPSALVRATPRRIGHGRPP